MLAGRFLGTVFFGLDLGVIGGGVNSSKVNVCSGVSGDGAGEALLLIVCHCSSARVRESWQDTDLSIPVVSSDYCLSPPNSIPLIPFNDAMFLRHLWMDRLPVPSWHDEACRVYDRAR